jgi:hypothetical protein
MTKKTQAPNAPVVIEESADWSMVLDIIFNVQSFITEHGTLLKEKERQKGSNNSDQQMH